MDRDVHHITGGTTFGTLTTGCTIVSVNPPKRNRREELREYLRDVNLIIKVIGGAIGISLGIREFLSKVRPLKAKPRPATYSSPSTQKEIQACRI